MLCWTSIDLVVNEWSQKDLQYRLYLLDLEDIGIEYNKNPLKKIM